MHILYFHQHFSTPAGAAGIRSYEMARQLVERGHTVTMVCGSYSGGATGITQAFKRGRRTGMVDGISIIEFDLAYSNQDNFLKRTWLFLKFAISSVSVALIHKYDIIFATSTPLTAGIPGIFAKVLRGKEFIFEVRDLWPELPREMGVIKNPIVLGLMSFLEWASYRSADRCIGLSPGIVKGIVKRGVIDSKIRLVPNGCDLSIFGRDNKGWRPAQVQQQDFMAIFTGTHGLANGLDSLLDAAKVLIRRGREDIKIVLVGEGRLKTALRGRARDEGLVNIIFHEPVNKAKLARLMTSADVGLQLLANIPAFYYGTSPNKFFDYIAAGLPVINNYPGWLADIITQHSCGFAVPPEDPEALADALQTAADNKDQLSIMGGNSRRLATDMFDRKKLADDWVNWVLWGK